LGSDVVQIILINGIDEQGPNNHHIHPNPSNGSFVIEINNKSSEFDVLILDATGKLVLQRVFTNRILIDEKLAAGSYTVQIRKDMSVINAKKLIVY